MKSQHLEWNGDTGINRSLRQLALTFVTVLLLAGINPPAWPVSVSVTGAAGSNGTVGVNGDPGGPGGMGSIGADATATGGKGGQRRSGRSRYRRQCGCSARNCRA